MKAPILVAALLAAIVCLGVVHAAPKQGSAEPETLYTLSPHFDAGDACLDTIHNRPHESKGLPPVELTFLEGVAPLVLCENGVAKVKIITRTYIPYYRDVAGLLKEYLDMVTGASFEIVDDRDPAVRGIFVGPLDNATSQELFTKAQTKGLDHFTVQSFDRGIVLVGKDADPLYGVKNNMPEKYQEIRARYSFYVRGTYFAAIDFLERFVGIRRYSPGFLGAYFPDLSRRRVVVPAVSYEDAPAFPYRSWTGPHIGNDAKYLKTSYREGSIWAAYRRQSTALQAIGNHTDCLWHEIYAGRPEFFAMRRDGTRMMGRKGHQSSQRCYTNEAGYQQHLKNIDDWYTYGDRTGSEYRTFTRSYATPNERYIYWMPNDGFPGCFCPACEELLAKHDSTYHPKVVQELHYAAKLGREMKTRWPGKILNYNLYGQKVIPAEFELPDNISYTKVFNSYCEAYWKEPKYLAFAQGMIDTMNDLSTEKAIIWSHYPVKPRQLSDINMPYPAPHVLAAFYRKNRDNVLGVHVNLGPWMSWAFDSYILYVYQSILWDPDVDPDGILDEYCATLFGPAAADMKAYFRLLIDRWENVKWSYTPDVALHRAAHLAQTFPAKLYWTETYPTEVRARLQGILLSAMAKTTPGTIYHQRLVHQSDVGAEFFRLGAAADSGTEARAECPVLTHSLTVDGSLDEWQDAVPLPLQESMTGKTAKIKTEFFTAHDAESLCIAGKVHEPVAAVLPTEPGAQLYEHDSVEIFLCPNQLGDDEGGFNKRGRFYQLILNARGDVVTTHRGQNKRDTEKIALEFDRAVKPMGKGFQFEIRIPHASINALPPQPGDEWAANFYRNRKRDDGSERYYAWSPTMGKAFFYTETFGLLQFPKPVLLTAGFDGGTVWDKAAPGTEHSFETRDGVGILRVTYPASADKPVAIGFYSNAVLKDLAKPISVSSAIRYNGVGVSEIEFWARSKAWEKMEYRYNPAANPGERVQSETWQHLNVDRAVKRGAHGKVALDKISDFYAIGVTATIHPGADFMLEVRPAKVCER
ncbi:MAG: DUF4838 domain-containing protein [Lentisphaerae bacterium]|jgi:hypothetical protein|nr:DUF4838 domain-containing protein [Lentisphaerota bacterium]MBT7056119.1 DUF4838 domain-containing protein [Lentisphaerota bacterium]MBT7841357.1 DUF4838 domain-containing protein [Lentisphaerota bacterium]